MKKTLLIATAVLAMFVSCKKSGPIVSKGEGFLSFEGLVLSKDDMVETKAVSAASGNYSIIVLDADENEVVRTTYASVKAADNKLSLPAGDYTLVARSTEDEAPMAAFEQPVYGVSKSFSIAAGEVTSIGSLTCTLVQVKVTVDYSDEFKAMVTGDCKASVEVTSGYPLEYDMPLVGGIPSPDKSAGYFAVKEGTSTMVVTFSGNVEGKSVKQTKAFTGIAAKQWRQVKFVKKYDAQGNATFEIVINDMVDDETLNNMIAGNENIIGDDPDRPAGDGGILMEFDYANGCDPEFTDFTNLVFPSCDPKGAPTISLKLKATVPNGIKKFTVKIESTNSVFISAVAAAVVPNSKGEYVLDLINPTADNEIIFQVVPFPHGSDLAGLTNVAFDLSNAQVALYSVPYVGDHNFEMTITDMKGCSKTIPVVMIVR